MFDNVSFSYTTGKTVLNNFNLENYKGSEDNMDKGLKYRHHIFVQNKKFTTLKNLY